MAKPLAFTPTGTTYGDDFTLVPPGTVKTAVGDTGSGRAVGRIHTLRFALAVTAFTGTNVTFNIQTSPDGSTWTTHTSFTAVTAPGSQRKVISALDRYVRISWTGTFTSVTFGITGESVGGEDSD